MHVCCNLSIYGGVTYDIVQIMKTQIKTSYDRSTPEIRVVIRLTEKSHQEPGWEDWRRFLPSEISGVIFLFFFSNYFNYLNISFIKNQGL